LLVITRAVPALVLWAVRCANVRFGILPSRSREGRAFNSRRAGHPVLDFVLENKELDSGFRFAAPE
jgi:hypothetical protein